MAKKKPQAAGGAPDWLVTFADLMSLLVCFFVLIISFSIQDKEKLQIVAGSMREAFGVKKDSRKAGVIEVEGVPVRDYLKRIAAKADESDSDFAAIRHNKKRKQGPEANTYDIERADIEHSRQFATAAATLRQAWQEMPEISEISKNIILEESKEGLNIQLLDQRGRSMFPEGSKYPFEATRKLITAMAPVLAKMPNRIKISGHTTKIHLSDKATYTNWELSADRANAIRHILANNGVRSDKFYAVVGRADKDPLFPNDPDLIANRRITILLMAEEPPLPHEHKP